MEINKIWIFEIQDGVSGGFIIADTEDKDDWCLEIPKELVQKKGSYYKCDKNCVIYCINEEEALRIAKVYTELAKEIKG